jgi:hypothetical protein
MGIQVGTTEWYDAFAAEFGAITGWRVERKDGGLRVWPFGSDGYRSVFFQDEPCDGSYTPREAAMIHLHDQWEWLRPGLPLAARRWRFEQMVKQRRAEFA